MIHPAKAPIRLEPVFQITGTPAQQILFGFSKSSSAKAAIESETGPGDVHKRRQRGESPGRDVDP